MTKNHVVTFKISNEEACIIENALKLENINKSDFIRKLLRAYKKVLLPMKGFLDWSNV